MKQLTIGVFDARDAAEKAINHLHRDLDIAQHDISYVYRNTEGKTEEIDARDIASNTPREGAAKGATIGGVLGAIAGIATAAGALPVIGPIFAAGPLMAALGITGAVGTTAAGAVTGAAAGGIIGALAAWGVDTEHAQQYEDQVRAGNILVSVHADEDLDTRQVLEDYGAQDVRVYQLKV